MSIRFTKAFKEQAVEKILTRADNTTIQEVADSLGVSISTLNRWKLQSRMQDSESAVHNEDCSGQVKLATVL